MRPLHLRLPAALAIVLTLAGCGLSDPYTSQHPATTSTSTSAIPTTTTATVPNADPAPERGGTIPNAAHAVQNKLAASAGMPTPQAALERYANLDINWTARHS
jgi:predicted small lipoprotein YifL